MASPWESCGVGDRERLRRMGEQAGVLRFELLAVLDREKAESITIRRKTLCSQYLQRVWSSIGERVPRDFAVCALAKLGVLK